VSLGRSRAIFARLGATMICHRGYIAVRNIPGQIPAPPATAVTNPRLPGYLLNIMKNEPFFSFTAAVILAGVVAAFASSTSTPAAQPLAPGNSIKATVTAPLALVAPSATSPVPSAAAHLHRAHHHAVEKS
jgi:hypothetical protein